MFLDKCNIGWWWFTHNNNYNGITSIHYHLYIYIFKFYHLLLPKNDSTYHITIHIIWKVHWHQAISQWFFCFSFIDFTLISFKSLWSLSLLFIIPIFTFFYIQSIQIIINISSLILCRTIKVVICFMWIMRIIK